MNFRELTMPERQSFMAQFNLWCDRAKLPIAKIKDVKDTPHVLAEDGKQQGFGFTRKGAERYLLQKRRLERKGKRQ